MAMGLALDWSAGTLYALGTFCLACVGAEMAGKEKKKRILGFLLAGAGAILLTGGLGGSLWIAMALGAGLSYLFPPLGLWNQDSPAPSSAADALERVYRELENPTASGRDSFQKDLFFLQQKSRRRELRSVVACQYRILADFLRLQGADPSHSAPQWEPRTEFSQRAKDAICGDRVWELRRENRYFLLLCDGMGTGQAAMEDGARAEELLGGLLSAGMAADDALETLNLTAILKEGAGECALDLVEVDLTTGEAVLYKWGGAPSYLMTAQGVKKVGTVSLPPGIGVGGTHQPQQIKLSLRRGEALILTTDGIDGEVAETSILRGRDCASAVLAATLVENGCSEGEDDGTAVVLKLRPVSAH
jgi:hypothetical protein